MAIKTIASKNPGKTPGFTGRKVVVKRGVSAACGTGAGTRLE